MPLTTNDALLEAWAEQIETMEQNLESLYGPPGITPALPLVTTEEGMLGAMTELTEVTYLNFAKMYNKYHDVTSEDYTITIPAGLLDWYGLKKLGGKTVVMNQSIDVSTTGWTKNRCNLALTDEVYEMTCTSDAYAFYGTYQASQTQISGHVYLYSCEFKVETTNLPKTFEMLYTVGGENVTAKDTWHTYKKIYKATSDITTAINVAVRYASSSDVTVGDKVYFRNAMKIDLTQMFGAGNEPGTTAEVEELLPADYYEYNTGELMPAGVTQVVSKDSDSNIIDTLVIPDEVQALTGYGWSCPNKVNYIDFEAKKFVQNVGFVDLSTLTFGYGPSVGWSATLPNVKNPADDDTAFNGLSATLKVTDRNTQATAFSGGTDAGMVSVAGGKVYVGTGSISIVPSGTLIYELDTPVETDISEYLANYKLNVEAGGTVTFEQADENYCIPAYNEVEYIAI